MKKIFKNILLLSLCASFPLFISCSDDDSNTGEKKEGYATGKVVDGTNNPIPGATVRIDNTMFYNSNTIVTTDSGGFYETELATVGTYNVTAVYKKELNGQIFTVDLHPEIDEIMSNAGGVRNFQWKLTGKKVDGLGYYGGSISINSDVGSNIFDSENIEFTLVPVGKLIDGSTGETIVMKEGAPFTPDYGYLVDIPLGRYIISAMYTKEDGEVPLRIRKKFDGTSVYATEFELDFEPETSVGKNMAIIEYDE